MTQRTVAGRISHSGSSSKGLIIGIVVAALAGAIVASVLVTMLTNRGSFSSVSTTASQAPASTQGGQAVPSGGQAKPGESEVKLLPNSVRIGDLLIAVSSRTYIEKQPQESWLYYVAVDATVQNVLDRPYEIGPGDFHLKGSDGKVVGYEDVTEGLYQHVLAPGKTAQGTLLFKVLKGTKPVELQYVSRRMGGRDSGVIPLK